MYQYEVTKTRPPLTRFELYGIVCMRKQAGKWIPAAVVAPFSSDREAVAGLAEKCTVLQLCPERLIETISEFLPQTAIDNQRHTY